MPTSPEHAVIAVFDDAAKADQVAHEMMAWDKANPDIKLGAIGMLTREVGDWGQGKIKTENFSSRNTGKGAKVGMGLGVLAAVFSGGLTLIPGVVGGAVVGAAAGSLSRTGLGITEEERQQLVGELEGGRAALLVMCDEEEVTAVNDYLVAAGGRPQSHVIDDADLQAASAAAETSAPPASSA